MGNVCVYPRMRGTLGETSLNMTGRRGRVRPMVAWFGGVEFVKVGCAYFSIVAGVCDWVTLYVMMCGVRAERRVCLGCRVQRYASLAL